LCISYGAKAEVEQGQESPLVDATEYRSLIGGLRYLMNTRPDITFAVNYLSRFLEKPKEDHCMAVKHLLRYVAGTLDDGVFYRREEKGVHQLIGYSDSDYAGDIDVRKSTSGMLYCLGSSPITWSSGKQKVVALSSCEAEYIATAYGACQGVWLAQLLKGLIGSKPGAPILRIDNKSAIDLAKNPVHHERSKHIETKYHYIKKSVEDGKISLEQVPTGDQLADIMTKSLARVKFLELRDQIGVVNIKSQHQA
jgi:hypothetical protein